MKKIITKNKSAFYDYQILKTLQVGIKLFGSEVKACRQNLIHLKGSYVTIIKGQLILLNCNISNIYSKSFDKIQSNRERLLLAHKYEILKLSHQIKEKGLTLIPLEMYFEKNLIKLDIGICRGKHNYDKCEQMKLKEKPE